MRAFYYCSVPWSSQVSWQCFAVEENSCFVWREWKDLLFVSPPLLFSSSSKTSRGPDPVQGDSRRVSGSCYQTEVFLMTGPVNSHSPDDGSPPGSQPVVILLPGDLTEIFHRCRALWVRPSLTQCHVGGLSCLSSLLLSIAPVSHQEQTNTSLARPHNLYILSVWEKGGGSKSRNGRHRPRNNDIIWAYV